MRWVQLEQIDPLFSVVYYSHQSDWTDDNRRGNLPKGQIKVNDAVWKWRNADSTHSDGEPTGYWYTDVIDENGGRYGFRVYNC